MSEPRWMVLVKAEALLAWAPAAAAAIACWVIGPAIDRACRYIGRTKP